MDHKQLILLLKAMSKKEVTSFFKHLKGQHKDDLIALKVFEYLKNLHPKGLDKPKKLDPSYAYEKIFEAPIRKDKHGEKKLQNTCSELYNWLRNYLIGNMACQDDLISNTLWIRFLQQRNMKESYKSAADKLYSKVNQKVFNQTDDGIERLVAGYHYWGWLMANPEKRNYQKAQSCAKILKGCMEVQRLKLECLESLLKRFKQPVSDTAAGYSPQSFHLLRDIYESLWKITDSGDLKHFTKLSELLTEWGQQVHPDELLTIIRYVHSFSAAQSRKRKNTEVYSKAHEMDKLGLELGVYQQNGKINSITFLNIVTIASISKQFSWAMNFIEKNKQAVLSKALDSTLLLARAIVANGQKKPVEVLRMLEGHTFEERPDNLRARALLIRSYYELKMDPDTILVNCQDLENLIRKPDMSNMEKGLLSFTTIVKLLALRRSGKKLILSKLEKAEHIYSHEWLLEKANAYKQ